RVCVDVNVIDIFGERSKPQTVGQPVGKIVRLELQPQARRDEMKVETGVAEMGDAIAKLVQRASAAAQGRSYFDAFAKVETLQRGLSRKMGKRRAKLGDKATEIATQ